MGQNKGCGGSRNRAKAGRNTQGRQEERKPPMKRLINKIAGRQSNLFGRARSSLSRQLQVENLETRLVPTTLGNISSINNIGPISIGPANPGTDTFKHVILDFDGGLISDQEMMEGGWPASNSPTRPSLEPIARFRDLFTGDDSYTDYNLNVAEQSILAQVRAIFAPYQVDFTIGVDVAQYEGLLTGSQTGNAIVMITGGSNIFTVNGPGASPRVDVGNHGNELAFVFAQDLIPNGASSNEHNTDVFRRAVAQEIAHQLGHCFGLYDVLTSPVDGVTPHDIMGSPSYGTAGVFPDIPIQDVMLNTVNAHQYLLSVLGASPSAWMAVLKPGELTISGDDTIDNSITITRLPDDPNYGSSWQVVLNTQTAWGTDSNGALIVWTSGNSPLSNWLNTFDQDLTRINIDGRGGNDTITVYVPADAYIWGGSGNNTLDARGAFSAHVWGGTGTNTIYGTLSGDNVLVGGTGGANSLYGGAGNNTLDGGNNGFVTNYLYGGTGPNIFFQHRDGHSIFGRFDRDQIFNFHTGDIIWTGQVFTQGFTPPAPDMARPSLTALGTNLSAVSAQAMTLASFNDGGFGGTASSYTAILDWGDGHSSYATVADDGQGGFIVTGSNTYQTEGRYTATVTIMGNGVSVTTTTLIHVARTGAPPATLLQVAGALTHSAEYYTNFVTAAYSRYLGRSPDAAGLAGWVGAMQNGSVSDEQLEAQFIGSTEYIQNHGCLGAAWIRGMYQDLLGRQPSDPEVQAWVGFLSQGGSPITVAFDFAASPEREAIRIQNDYQTYLGRAASQAEVDVWVLAFNNHQATNEDVIAGFVGSPEYFAKHYANAADWIFSAFNDILGRNPDQATYAAWLSYLENS
jgi:hypothetical protein